MTNPLKTTTNYIIITLIAVLAFLFYAQGLGKLALEFEPDENLYYQSSRRMVETEDFTSPYYFEKKRFEKPILYYWFVASSIKIFGLSWPAARVVSVLFSVLFLMLLYNFCMFFYDRKTAVASVLISATFLCFFRYARVLLPESAFLLFLFSFLYLFIKEILRPENKIRLIMAYIFLGLATLLKGPVAIVVAVLTIFLYFKIAKRPLSPKDACITLGLLIVCIIVLPWFVRMIQLYGGEYLKHIFFREIKERVFFITGSGLLKDLRHFLKGFVYFIPVILYFYLPWSIFIPHALHKELEKQRAQRDDAGILLFAYIVVIFLFFSLIHEKHRHYMLYMTPALAIFIAKFLTQKLASPGLKFISAAIFIMTIAVYFLGIAINRNSYTLDEMFSRNQYKFSEDDLIAVGSLQIHPYLLEANVNRPVLRMCINMGNEAETRQETWNLLNWELFNPHPDKSFCLLTKEDYYSYTFKPYIQKTLRVVGSAYVPIKPDIKNVYLSVLKRDKALFWDSFRRKAVFITNKESVK